MSAHPRNGTVEQALLRRRTQAIAGVSMFGSLAAQFFAPDTSPQASAFRAGLVSLLVVELAGLHWSRQRPELTTWIATATIATVVFSPLGAVIDGSGPSITLAIALVTSIGAASFLPLGGFSQAAVVVAGMTACGVALGHVPGYASAAPHELLAVAITGLVSIYLADARARERATAKRYEAGLIRASDTAQRRAQRLEEQRGALESARQRALESDRLKSQFIATMSHEIRTPLNAVIGMSDLLMTSKLTQGERQDFIETIHRSGRTLLSIVDSILDISKIESGAVELDPRPTDIRQLASEIVGMVEHRAQEDVVMRWEVHPAVPDVVTLDDGRLRQILLNLLSNAAKFTASGSIRLRIRRHDERHLEMSVSDTGIGMSDAELTRVFEPFRQADPSTTRRFGGTGLGLAIARGLVVALGGSIEAQSSLGEGTTMRCTVAFEENGPLPEVEAPGDTVPAENLSELSLLVAEDNKVNQRVIVRLLQRAGIEPDVVDDGAAAVEAVLQRRYDVVLMDIQMPEMDGLEACRVIQERCPAGDRPQIIAVTANATTADRHRCLEAGMADFLPKPITSAELTRALAAARIRERRRANGKDGGAL